MFGHAPLSSAFGDTVLFPIYGHQGGWDEVLLVAIPLGLIAGLLWIANKRVNAQLKEAERVDSGQADTGHSTPKNL
jgi:cyanate permease